jgi:hypothetical protein
MTSFTAEHDAVANYRFYGWRSQENVNSTARIAMPNQAHAKRTA